ncbi:hypothetical protein JK364_44555 [Streptomyces sp. 110]|uniref:Uncharacterized protein n=1 Tax=Streptomyces endocoffeicus TaxID=2898945 RepID=A0ABS1Q3Z9_9ACTN|nr:hypothetical protein [Streptomyces endocoffeicus]
MRARWRRQARGAEAWVASITRVWDQNTRARSSAVTSRERFGAVDMVSFAPVTKTPNVGVDIVGPEAMTVENTQAQPDVQLHGAIRTVRRILPEMVERGSGTPLFTTAYTAGEPLPFVANFGIAGPAVRYDARTLHSAEAGKGVHVVHISVNAYINTEPGKPRPTPSPSCTGRRTPSASRRS